MTFENLETEVIILFKILIKHWREWVLFAACGHVSVFMVSGDKKAPSHFMRALEKSQAKQAE